MARETTAGRPRRRLGPWLALHCAPALLLGSSPLQAPPHVTAPTHLRAYALQQLNEIAAVAALLLRVPLPFLARGEEHPQVIHPCWAFKVRSFKYGGRKIPFARTL